MVSNLDCVFVTNDDGLNEGMESLITYLHSFKIPLLVVIPKENKSASSMSISLREKMRLSRQLKLEEKFRKNEAKLKIFTLDGTPTDCSLFVDFAKGSKLFENMTPIFAVSGVNQGANLGHDVLHSGTVGAARKASMNGLPSIASSYCDYSGDGISNASKITSELCLSIWKNISNSDPISESFFKGDVFLNINVPSRFNGELRLAKLGIRDYENALMLNSIDGNLELDVSFEGAKIVELDIDDTDVTIVKNGFASLSIIPTWPYSHPRYPQPEILGMLDELNSIDDLTWIKFNQYNDG